MSVVVPVKAATLRCAIYTRKSSEEGLEQSFNSLHAQREACEAYVLSQAGEGWTASATAYDDGGFSGGSLVRPGLTQLLADIKAGLVDVVVVYKVDRLTRSLTDFARIVDVFDQAGVSFVSVTQAFNTTTSMGRLTLNVLLSFAQFEREVTGERIRDKIAASKAKGMWMGGTLSLGYDLDGRSLVINEAEAETVRHVFRRYLALGSVHRLRDELEAQGVRSKAWTTRDGRARGGAVIGRGALFHLLRNRLFVGEIQHKDQVHPGLHPAILERKLFDKVQRRLDEHAVQRNAKAASTGPAPLTGVLYDSGRAPMLPTFACGRGGRRYRYYVSRGLQTGQPEAARPGSIRRVGAAALESFVVEQLRRLADRPALGAKDLPGLVRRLELRHGDTQLVVDVASMFGADHPELAVEDLRARLRPGERAVLEPGDPAALRLALPVRMQLRGGRTWVTHGDEPAPATGKLDAGLVAALRSAHEDLKAANASPLTSTAGLAAAKAPDSRHQRQVGKLAFLAPDLQQMILEGRQPPGVTLRLLLRADLPLCWEDQRAWFAGLTKPGAPSRKAMKAA